MPGNAVASNAVRNWRIIKSYLAPFVVQGGVDLIQLGWAGGFGNGNSQGFGMAGA